MIWVDADSCPVQVRDLIIRFALRLSIPANFVANRPIPLQKDPLINMIVTDDGPDAADDYIVQHINETDLAITRDIPLASRLVKDNRRVINDRGVVYTESNINERLAIRNLHKELFDMGLTPEKTGSFGKKELNAFANSLDRELQKIVREIKK